MFQRIFTQNCERLRWFSKPLFALSHLFLSTLFCSSSILLSYISKFLFKPLLLFNSNQLWNFICLILIPNLIRQWKMVSFSYFHDISFLCVNDTLVLTFYKRKTKKADTLQQDTCLFTILFNHQLITHQNFIINLRISHQIIIRIISLITYQIIISMGLYLDITE